MPEVVLFKIERTYGRDEIADYLDAIAESLRAGDPIILRSGDDELVLEPPARPTFEVKAEREGPEDGPGELSIEFELEWDENGGDADFQVG